MITTTMIIQTQMRMMIIRIMIKSAMTILSIRMLKVDVHDDNDDNDNWNIMISSKL